MNMPPSFWTDFTLSVKHKCKIHLWGNVDIKDDLSVNAFPFVKAVHFSGREGNNISPVKQLLDKAFSIGSLFDLNLLSY